MILHDAAKIQFKNAKGEITKEYFYSKASICGNGVENDFYEKKGFTRHEGKTSILADGEIISFDAITNEDRNAAINEGFSQDLQSTVSAFAKDVLEKDTTLINNHLRELYNEHKADTADSKKFQKTCFSK